MTVHAQARPATSIAGASQMAARMPAQVVVRQDAKHHRQPVLATASTPALKFTSGDVPDIEIRAKDEWFQDQDVQWRGSKVAFKRRF